MVKWRPSANPEDLTPQPGFGVGHPPPPHISTYEGLSHVSGQIEDVARELAEIKMLLAKYLKVTAG